MYNIIFTETLTTMRVTTSLAAGERSENVPYYSRNSANELAVLTFVLAQYFCTVQSALWVKQRIRRRIKSF